MTSDHDPLSRTIPTAQVSTRPGWSWAWLVPLAALAVSVWIGWRAQLERGPLIEVRAAEGHGIGPGDPVRYRGIDVGEIVAAELDDDLAHVVLRARLSRQAAPLATTGTRFWIVRPHLSLDEVTGLETVFGARYLEALPGSGPGEPQLEFLALEEPPILLQDEEGSLEVILIAPRRYGLQPGAPITYRQVQVGRVLSVGLASDASGIELRANIRPQYARLVCENTRFWEESGIDFRAGLFGGLEVELESLRALVVGAVAFATPSEPGAPVLNGHRFALAKEPDESWLAWRPALPVGLALLPPDSPTPHPMRAKLTWTREQLFMKRKYRRTAWVLSIDGGLLGPAELLAPPELADEEGLELQVAGRSVPFGGIRWEEAGLALLDGGEPLGIPWPTDWVRTPEALEDVLVVGDPAAEPLALSSARFREEEGAWILERGTSLGEEWHGAFAFSRTDGQLVGVLLVEGDEVRLVPVPGL